MAKVTKASKTTKAKAKPAVKAAKSAKVMKAKPVKKSAAKPANKPVSKTSVPATKKTGTKRMLNDAKIAKLQKMYESGKYSAQKICDEFGISMATLFNYLKVNV